MRNESNVSQGDLPFFFIASHSTSTAQDMSLGFPGGAASQVRDRPNLPAPSVYLHLMSRAGVFHTDEDAHGQVDGVFGCSKFPEASLLDVRAKAMRRAKAECCRV